MNEEQKKRYVSLKLEQQKRYFEKKIQQNTLLQECLATLGNYEVIEDEAIINKIIEISKDDYDKRYLSDISCIDAEVWYYILWDDKDTPVIRCKGTDILRSYDDVEAVAFYFVLSSIDFSHHFLFGG